MPDVKRREFIALLGGVGLLLAVKVRRARGQQPATPVIVFLHAGSPEPNAEFVTAFRRGLREAGFVEGQNVTIEYRWAEGSTGCLKWRLTLFTVVSPSSRRRSPRRRRLQPKQRPRRSRSSSVAAPTRSHSALCRASAARAATSPASAS